MYYVFMMYSVFSYPDEHRAASPTINVNVLKLCGAFREASPKIAAQLSGASKPSPAAAPCPGGIFVRSRREPRSSLST